MFWGRGGGGSAVKLGQPLTEHGVQADEAADEAVKVDVHVLVGVAHGDDVVELVVQPKPCGGPETGPSWGSGWRLLLQPINKTKGSYKELPSVQLLS